MDEFSTQRHSPSNDKNGLSAIAVARVPRALREGGTTHPLKELCHEPHLDPSRPIADNLAITEYRMWGDGRGSGDRGYAEIPSNRRDSARSWRALAWSRLAHGLLIPNRWPAS